MLSADGIAPWDPIVLGLARQTSGVKSLLLPVRSVVNEKAAHRSAPAIERAPVATSDIVRLIARVLISLTVALNIVNVWQLQFVGSGDVRAGMLAAAVTIPFTSVISSMASAENDHRAGHGHWRPWRLRRSQAYTWPELYSPASSHRSPFRSSSLSLERGRSCWSAG